MKKATKVRVSFGSKERYNSIVDILASTSCRLDVTMEEYIEQKPTATSKVRSICLDCSCTGVVILRNVVDGSVQGCICNGQVKWSSERGKLRLDQIIKSTRFEWADYDNRHINVLGRISTINLVCPTCLADVSTTIDNIRGRGDEVGCGCDRRAVLDSQYRSDAGKQKVDDLVANSRFGWKNHDNRHDGIDNEMSRLLLICSVCGVDVSPTINKLRQDKVGCGCDRRKMLDSDHASISKRQELDALVSESRFDWVDYPGRHTEAANASSRMNLVCNLCNESATPSIHHFRQHPVGCGCRLLKYGSPSGKKRVDELVNQSRFRWATEPNGRDDIETSSSHIRLLCSKCGEETTPSIAKLARDCVGCGCRNSTEMRVLDYIRTVCSEMFPMRRIRAVLHHRDKLLRGVGGRPLELDIIMEELHDTYTSPLLFVEVDGGHHFNPNFRYRPSGLSSLESHTFEHDVLKENFALVKLSSMVRLEQRSVEHGRVQWKQWIRCKIAAAVNGDLPNQVYRLSSGNQYRSGVYASMRQGTNIDPLV
tara:strand:+ start:120 stop:1730 length:1611 start_codon:yes stop_codon:yes gene_type:complete